MKKILALVLAALMVMAMGVSAMAVDTIDPYEGGTFTLDLNKEYTIKGAAVDTVVYPPETLNFTVEQADGPEDVEGVTVEAVKVTGATGKYDLKITLPEITTAGQYHFIITEDEGTTQGVTYNTAEEDAGNQIVIAVLVEFAYDGNKGALVVPEGNVVLSHLTDDAEKNDTFYNEYDLGNLTVQKKIAGNMASPTQYFTVFVTFEIEEGKTAVSSEPITVAGGSDTRNPATVTIAEVNAGTQKTFYLKADETLTFSNIPAGVKYTVAEDEAAHKATTSPLSMEETNDPSKGYTITYTNATGSIEAEATKAAVITNTKEATPDTGITLETLPYVLVLGIALAGVALMIIRRRRNED